MSLQTIVLQLTDEEASVLKFAVSYAANNADARRPLYNAVRDAVMDACAPDDDQRREQFRGAVVVTFRQYGFVGICRMLEDYSDGLTDRASTASPSERRHWSKCRAAVEAAREAFVYAIGNR